MKKYIIILTLFISCVFLDCNATELNIDNQKIQFDNPIINIKGVSYIPAREFFEKTGFDVNWNQEKEMIEIKSKKYPLYKENLESRDAKVYRKDFMYKFYGDTQFSFTSLEETKKDLTDSQVYARIPDAERAAEIGRVYLKTSIDMLNYEVVMDVSYSSILNAWSVTYHLQDKNLYTHNDTPTVVFSADDGRILKIYQGN